MIMPRQFAIIGQLFINFIQIIQIIIQRKMNQNNHTAYPTMQPHLILPLLQGYRSRRNHHDVWQNLEQNWDDFYWLTGELPHLLGILVRHVHAEFPKGRGRSSKLAFRNQVLLTMIWLRRYPTMFHLSNMFGISVSAVCKIIHQMIPKLHAYVVPRYINWHTHAEWQNLAGYIQDWPSVVAILDCTPFRISRPKGHLQRLYYRRDRGFVFLNWVCIVDVKGFVVYSRPGFVGHLHDSTCYGHVQIPALPAGLRIMADQGFANRHPLLLPVIRGRQQNLPPNIRRSFRKHRSMIERVFGVIKMSYAGCGTRRYRGRRFMASLICNLSAALFNRRKIIFFMIRRSLRV